MWCKVLSICTCLMADRWPTSAWIRSWEDLKSCLGNLQQHPPFVTFRFVAAFSQVRLSACCFSHPRTSCSPFSLERETCKRQVWQRTVSPKTNNVEQNKTKEKSQQYPCTQTLRLKLDLNIVLPLLTATIHTSRPSHTPQKDEESSAVNKPQTGVLYFYDVLCCADLCW